MFAVRARERSKPEVLRRVRRSPRGGLPLLWSIKSAAAEVLRRVWSIADPGYLIDHVPLPRDVHPQTSGREDPDLQGSAGGRAQAGDRTLRRPQGLDGIARRPRP